MITDSNGQVVNAIRYDSFGSVIEDSIPSFEISFGFAGGFYDQDTGLVRFGYRDYDPVIGRWTARDPIGFSDGDTNLYGYVLGDPVNLIDVPGLSAENINFMMNQLSSMYSDYSPNGDWSFGKVGEGNIAETNRWTGDMTFPLSWNNNGCLSLSEYIDQISMIFHEGMRSSDSFWTRLFDHKSSSHHASIWNRQRWEFGSSIKMDMPTNIWGSPGDNRPDIAAMYRNYKSEICVCDE